MHYLLAIDPGVRRSGWAAFYDGVLTACGHDENNVVAEKIGRNGQLCVERPRVYNGRSAKGDTQDLLDLSVEVGFFCGVAFERGVAFATVLPEEWKGQVPKNVTAARLDRTLTAAEWEQVPLMPRKRVPNHNVLDAIAIGCRMLNRRMRAPAKEDLP